MKRKIFSILFALVLVLSLGLVTAVPVAVSAAGPAYTFEGSTIAITSLETPFTEQTEDAFIAEPHTTVVDGVAFDAQTCSQVVIEGTVSALDLGAGWMDTAYVEIGLRPEATKTERNAGVYLIAYTAHTGDKTVIHLQDYTGMGFLDGVINIPKDSDFRYKITLDPSGEIGGTATLEVWVGEASQGTVSGFVYGYASTWDEGVAGLLDENFPSAHLFYSIIAECRGAGGITYSATVGDITIDDTLYVGTGQQFTTIQAAIGFANPGDTISMAVGTYDEVLNLGGKGLTIEGAGVDSTTVDASAFTGYAIQNFGDSTTFRALTVIGSSNYCFKVSHVSDFNLDSVRVENSGKTAFDLNTVDGANLNDIEAVDTVAGFGLMILDSNDVTVNTIATRGNAWGGVSVQTKNGPTNYVTFSGSFDVEDDIPLLLEKDPPGYYDITNVEIPPQFEYVVYAFREGDNYQQAFYQETLDNAKAFARSLIDSTAFTYSDMLIHDIAEENYYVIEGMKVQDAIDAATGTTITCAAGTYSEAIVIDKPLTLRGATAGVNKNGYTVPENYAWDDTVESIINHPNPSGGYTTIVDIVDTDNVTFEGFVVQELDAVGNLNSSLVRVYAHTQEISNIVVRNNIIGPNTNTTAQDGAQGRMGLYIVNHPYSDQFGVIDSTFSSNKIFDCKGNGNNVFIWSSYYAYGASGPASMSGTVIEDNEIYGSHRSGIETAGGYSGLTIQNNKIYGNSGLLSDDPNMPKYGHGIVLIRGVSDKLGGATTAYGPEDLTIVDNEIYDNEKSGIYMGPINTDYTITGNDIYDNGWDGIMVDLEGQYWNPTFEDEPDPWDEHACYDGSENIAANLNNIYDNDEYGVRVIGTPTNGFVLDATYNWWGHASGPGRELSNGKWVGKGDKVSDNVDYKPWLHKSKEDVVPTKKPSYAQSVVLDNTGEYGWNTFSAPIFLDDEVNTWKKLYDLTDLAYSVAYRFDSDIQEFVLLIRGDEYAINPGEGFFIKMDDVGSLTILYSTEENLIPPSRPLTAGWNLIGLANLEDMDVDDAFPSIATVSGLAGYSQVVSPIGNAEPGPVLADGTIYVGEGYWVYMLGARTLAGFTMTPVEWVP